MSAPSRLRQRDYFLRPALFLSLATNLHATCFDRPLTLTPPLQTALISLACLGLLLGTGLTLFPVPWTQGVAADVGHSVPDEEVAPVRRSAQVRSLTTAD